MQNDLCNKDMNKPFKQNDLLIMYKKGMTKLFLKIRIFKIEGERYLRTI